VTKPELKDLLEDIRSTRGEARTLRNELDRVKRELAVATRNRAATLQQVPDPVPVLDSSMSDARGEWEPANPRIWNAIALGIIIIAAIATRVIDLESIPNGIQGDEAAVGLESRRVLDEGWIGLYSPAAAGTPTGYYLMAAPFVAVFGDTILAVRLLSATLGVLSVIALWFLLRRNLGFITAVLGTGLYAILGWNLIFSRISFLTISWPFLAISSLALQFEAVRTRRWEWWFGAGAVSALGLYTYNGHSLFMLLQAAFAGWTFFRWRSLPLIAIAPFAATTPGVPTLVLLAAATILILLGRQIRDPQVLSQAFAFAAGVGIPAYPLASWILDNRDLYFGRGERLSLFRSDQWTLLDSTWEKVHFLGDRYLEFWNRMTFNPVPDTVDTSGIVPIVPISLLVLMGLGIVLSLVRRRDPLVQLGAITVLVMPVASIAFTDFALRRSLIIAPFVVMFAALALVEIVRALWRRHPGFGVLAMIPSAIILTWIAWQSLHGYFVTTQQSRYTEWVLGPDLVAAIEFMNDQPDDAYFYFSSNRWPIGMEVLRWQAPGITGETRFEPYGENSTGIDPSLGRPIWILMGPNRDRLPELQELYPGGTVAVSDFVLKSDGRPAFIAFFPPWSP
jgi:hypothetical protein